MPSSSTAFLQALGSAQGSAPRITSAPPSVNRSTIQTGVAASSISTALPAPASAASTSAIVSGACTCTALPRCAGTSGQELAAVHEPVHVRVEVNDCEGVGEGAVGDVGAPHVQEPRDGIGGAQYCGGRAFLREPGGDGLSLVAGIGPGEARRMGSDGAERGRRLIRPQLIDGIVLARDQAGAGGAAGRRHPVALSRAVQPGVVAERSAFPEMLLEPRIRRLLGDVPVLVEGAIHLRRRLQGVPPVDEERRLLGQHDCHAGRAREAGEPRQPLRAARNVLALVLVAERHHEAIEAAPASSARSAASRSACCGASIPSGASARARRSVSSRSASAVSASASGRIRRSQLRSCGAAAAMPRSSASTSSTGFSIPASASACASALRRSVVALSSSMGVFLPVLCLPRQYQRDPRAEPYAPAEAEPVPRERRRAPAALQWREGRRAPRRRAAPGAGRRPAPSQRWALP